MSSKEQAQGNEKAASKQHSSQSKSQDFEILTQREQPTTIIQRARLDPRSLTMHDVQYLQRMIGNRAVGPLLTQAAQGTSHTGLHPVTQRKPAERIFEMPVQREEKLDEEEELQMKAEPAAIQRQEMEEEESLQGKFTISQTPAQREGNEGKTENRNSMPNSLKAGLEALSGMDLSSVRVYRNSDKPAKLNALAYTQGQDIYLGSGQEKYLPHEGWHVVQQMQGRVTPTMQANGVSINDDKALENEADVMGVRAEQLLGESNQINRRETGSGIRALHGTDALQRRQNSVVQMAAPLAFAGLSAEAWAMASSVASVIATVSGAVAGTYVAVRPGENRFASLRLPQNLISNGDKAKLQQIAQFRIINMYVERYLAQPENRHLREEIMGSRRQGTTPSSGTRTSRGGEGGAGSPSEGSERPSGAPTASGINQEVLIAVKRAVQSSVQTALETGTGLYNKEFMWGEDDTRGEGQIGESGSAESAGVTGFLQFRNMECKVLRERLSLSREANAAVGPIPDQNTEVIVHKFIGGRLGGRATWSAWDNLAVNVEGGAPIITVHPNGSPLLRIRTHWYWDRWGPNSESWMDHDIFVQDDGGMTIYGTYEWSS